VSGSLDKEGSGAMTRQSETAEDIENVEAWAEIIKHLLYLVPTDA
jgi:hypothetical protein